MSRELAKISQKRAKVSFGGPGSITFTILDNQVLGALAVLLAISVL